MPRAEHPFVCHQMYFFSLRERLRERNFAHHAEVPRESIYVVMKGNKCVFTAFHCTILLYPAQAYFSAKLAQKETQQQVRGRAWNPDQKDMVSFSQVITRGAGSACGNRSGVCANPLENADAARSATALPCSKTASASSPETVVVLALNARTTEEDRARLRFRRRSCTPKIPLFGVRVASTGWRSFRKTKKKTNINGGPRESPIKRSCEGKLG